MSNGNVPEGGASTPKGDRESDASNIENKIAILEKDILEKDKLEKDKLEKDKLEKDKLEKDKLEKDKLEKDKKTDLILERGLKKQTDTLIFEFGVIQKNYTHTSIKPLIEKIDKIQTDCLILKSNELTSILKEFTNKIEEIQKGRKIVDPKSKEEDQNANINSLNSSLIDIASSLRYNKLFFILPPCVLLAALLILGLLVKPLSMDPVNDRIDNLSTKITENSPNTLKGDIKGLTDVNKKCVADIKDLISKIDNPATLSNEITLLKTGVNKLLLNPLTKNDFDEIKTSLKTLGENKSTTFAKELSAELLKTKAFTDEIAKSSNQATKEALKLVDDKLKLISDSIKTNPKTDKIEDSLKSIDANFKSLKDSINKNSKTDKETEEKFIKIASEFDALNKSLQKVHVSSKPNHPFLLICSTTPTFNPGSLKSLVPLFNDIRKTIRENNRNIDWKMGLEWSSNYIPWFENDKDYVIVDNFGKAEPVFSSNFLNDIILDKQLNNNILSDVIIIVPLGTGGGLKTIGGTPIFMNGVRVHVIYLALPKEKNTITESMLGWSKFAATNGGGTFTVLTINEGAVGKPNEEDLVKKVKDHVLKLVQKFSY